MNNTNYNWNYPTTIWVGQNRIKDLSLACKKLNISKPLFVTDRELIKSNIVKKTLLDLKKENLSFETFSNVSGNPSGSHVEEGVNFFNIRTILLNLRMTIQTKFCRWYISMSLSFNIIMTIPTINT